MKGGRQEPLDSWSWFLQEGRADISTLGGPRKRARVDEHGADCATEAVSSEGTQISPLYTTCRSLRQGEDHKESVAAVLLAHALQHVAEYCRQCGECQKTTHRRVHRAPLIPLPIIDEPFHRIAMDIVGPLSRSRSGKRYILVVCDYATRYPEAIPLRSIDAECIAEELVTLFSRVGVPSEILTDQGSNFTSQLLTEIYRMLHVHPIRTTPYHPQTDGLVERFNKTLKSMLRKYATKEGKDWDKFIPYLLFAYREVPQASTGFSPFELLYGRSVRGPLDIVRESWEAREKSDESVVSHVLSMRKRLEKMSELARENLATAQARQKTWYDKNSRI